MNTTTPTPNNFPGLALRSPLAAVLAAAFLVLSLAAPAAAEDGVCGDVNVSGDVTASDALLVLRRSVGQQVAGMFCGLEAELGDPDDYHESPIIPANTLLGQMINVPRQSVITHFGIIARQSGAQARMAIYTDDNGSPGTLVGGTFQVELLLGAQEIPAAMNYPIAPGNYWLMANVGAETEVAADASTSNVLKYKEQSVSGNPGTFGPAMQFSGQRLNYWIQVLN